MLDDLEEFNKLVGPKIIFVLVGVFFFSLFFGGFYWNSYNLPTMHGYWQVNVPGKYLVMLSFLLFSILSISLSIFIPIIKSRLFKYSVYTAMLSFLVGSLILF